MSKEILLVVDSVSHEKGVSKDVIFDAIESALAMATKKRYEDNAEFRVAIDRESGEYITFRVWTVVDIEARAQEQEQEQEQEREREREREEAPGEATQEQELNPAAEIAPDDPRAVEAGLSHGDTIEEAVDSVAFGRIGAQTAKQVIVQKVREAERAQVVEEYLPRVGELVGGTVKKLGRDNIIVDLGNNAEGLLTREHLIPRETFRVGDRLRALLIEVRPDPTDGRAKRVRITEAGRRMREACLAALVPAVAELGQDFDPAEFAQALPFLQRLRAYMDKARDSS